MCTHTCACTSAGTLHGVRGLHLRPFSITPPCRQPYSVFGWDKHIKHEKQRKKLSWMSVLKIAVEKFPLSQRWSLEMILFPKLDLCFIGLGSQTRSLFHRTGLPSGASPGSCMLLNSFCPSTAFITLPSKPSCVQPSYTQTHAFQAKMRRCVENSFGKTHQHFRTIR